MRKSLSPIFSSGKLKGMMEPMSDEVDKYIEVLERECKIGKPMVIKNHLEGTDCAQRNDTTQPNLNSPTRHEFEHHREMRPRHGPGRA